MQDEIPLLDANRITTDVKVAQTSEGTAQNEDAPRVALLGWCDRAAAIEGVHPALACTNIQGLSYTRVSHFFPLSLQGATLIFGLYNPQAGESFVVEFLHSDGAKAFDVTLNVSQVQVFDATLTQAAGRHLVGWLVQAVQVSNNLLVVRPDRLNAFLKVNGEQRFLGSFNLLHAPVPLYSPDQVTALKSDPLARRIVRIKYSCPECRVNLQVYAALERNKALEGEGYVWFAELGDEFRCQCGKMLFSLQYLRTGLHGLLSRSLAPDDQAGGNYIRLYETTKLEEDCRQFKALLDKNVPEEEFQNFLETHPVFFARFSAHRLIPKPPILTKYFADFVILNQRKELLLVEIEKANIRLLTRERRITADLQHAVTQVTDWIQEVSDHKTAVLNSLGMELREVAVVRGVVIAGRTPSDDEDARALRRAFSGNVDFYTYDDLLRDTTEIIRRVANA